MCCTRKFLFDCVDRCVCQQALQLVLDLEQLLLNLLEMNFVRLQQIAFASCKPLIYARHIGVFRVRLEPGVNLGLLNAADGEVYIVTRKH